MVKLKAIRSTWKNKHKGSNVNLSHKLSPLPPPYLSNCVNCPTPRLPHLALDYKPIHQGLLETAYVTHSSQPGTQQHVLTLASLHSKHFRRNTIIIAIGGKWIILCWGFIVVDEFLSKTQAALREERMERNMAGRAVITVESLYWCGGKTTDSETLYNRCFKTEEKLYAQEQECAVLNVRGKVSWLHACVCVCVVRGQDISVTPPWAALPKTSPRVSRKRNVLIGEHCTERESQLARRSIQWLKSPDWIYICVRVCLCVQLVSVNGYSTQRNERWLSMMGSGLYRQFRCVLVCQCLDAKWQFI